MRTIKFRGYNRKNGEWLYGFYDEETKSFQIGIEEYVEMDSVERWAYLEDLVDL